MTTSTLVDLLGDAYDVEALAATQASVAVLDPAAVILWVNPAWRRFAQDNGAGAACEGWKSYLAAIAPPLRAFYAEAFARALATATPFEQDYECSTPDRRRLFHMRALPLGGRGLLVEHAVRAEEPADPARPPLLALYVDVRGRIAQCSNCRRIRNPATDAFDWVPAWVAQPHPATSHVICVTCEGYYWGTHGPVTPARDG